MPSTNSVSNLRVLDSSTVMTPSLPTLSITSAISLPISWSLAEMEATSAISFWPATGIAIALSSAISAATPCSIPRLSCSGLAPAVTFLKPSLTIAWASTVAVVVPSPAMSLVLVAASFRSWTPMFSKGSSSSISLAMVTPSLVMVGGPNFLSSTTLRPRGPSVILTASASLSTPRRSDERASSLYETCLAAIGLLPLLVGAVVDDGQDVGLAQDQELVVLVL